jgi:hypothetical protein
MAFGYELDFSLRILSPVTKPMTFVILLQSFPPLTGYDPLVPLTWLPVKLPPHKQATPAIPAPPAPAAATQHGLRSYLVLVPVLPPEHHVARGIKTAAEEVDLNLMSLYSLGSFSGGSKLRITFPFVANEGVAPVELASIPIPADELAGRIKNPPPLPEQLYQPDITPATTKYIGAGEDLSNFQALSGDPPALTPDKIWSWNGIGNVTLLAQDLVAADAEQKHLFWSGILIGVAGGGAIALALELIGLGEKLSERRNARKNATSYAH